MSKDRKYDLICIGGGIMSATLALLTKLLDESIDILVLERLDDVAKESTATLNNSGTGHSGYCELNYTPATKDGGISTTKAKRVFNEFERSKQFWSYLVQHELISEPESFVRKIPHLSWVKGNELVDFLQKRHNELSSLQPFEDMQFSKKHDELRTWLPLLFEDISESEAIAATRSDNGTEIDFENLTRLYFDILENKFGVPVLRGHEVTDLNKEDMSSWYVDVETTKGHKKVLKAEKVFIGAGGGALPLLQKAKIEDRDQYGGFPVSGQWLICKNRAIIEKHSSKAYTKAGVDAPPMAAPHLDTRIVNGKKELIFGPFAGFSTKFLKEGSYLDLPSSINLENIPAYWGAFWHNLPLTKYLIKQLTKDHDDRMNDLRTFIPNAKSEDWELKVAGQRVQIIKKDKEKGGDVEFGTDVVANSEGSAAALLGASPGASIAVNVMIDVTQKLFPGKVSRSEWRKQMDIMIPFWNRSYDENPDEFKRLNYTVNKNLHLNT